MRNNLLEALQNGEPLTANGIGGKVLSPLQMSTLAQRLTWRGTSQRRSPGTDLMSIIGLSIEKPGKSRILCLNMLQCLTVPVLERFGMNDTDIRTVICMMKCTSMGECTQLRNTTIDYLKDMMLELTKK